jgi:phosphohistidine phosphatase SixA
MLFKAKSSLNIWVFVSIILTTCFSCATKPGTAVTLYLVRHAERPSGVDSLNDVGKKRAMELANTLEHAGINAIYVSDTRRAEQTAQPLSGKIHVAFSHYKAAQKEEILTKLKAHPDGDRILVVGHSNNLPFILNGLGVSKDTTWLPHDQYDDLFQVLMYRKGKNQLNHLKYGKP